MSGQSIRQSNIFMITTPRNPFGPAVTIALFLCFFEMGPLFSVWTRMFFVIMNITAFLMFAVDKERAVDGRWRIRESHLHLVSLAGGFAGAQFAKSLFRHKTQKPSFHLVYWLSVFLWTCIGGLAIEQLEMERHPPHVKQSSAPATCPASGAVSSSNCSHRDKRKRSLPQTQS